MKLVYSLQKTGMQCALKSALALSLVLVTALGAFAAKLLFEDHQITADLTLNLCQKNENGEWAIVDKAQGTVNLTATTTGVASGDINTNHNWRFRSEKGRQVNVTLQRAGRFRLDAANGWLTFDLPFAVEVDGKRINQSIRLTNASLSTPLGQKGGKKAELDGRTVLAHLFGFTTVKARDLSDAANANNKLSRDSKIRTPGVVGGSAGLNGELILTLEVNGKAVW